jgi:hypothetical protein
MQLNTHKNCDENSAVPRGGLQVANLEYHQNTLRIADSYTSTDSDDGPFGAKLHTERDSPDGC